MPKPQRVAFMMDLSWPYKRHLDIFAGAQKYAQEKGWHSIIDEYAYDSLKSDSCQYDGVIGRATVSLARQAKRRNIPLVNVWLSSPVTNQVPGVFSDFKAAGQMRAELLISRGFLRFAALTGHPNRSHDRELKAFRRVVLEHGGSCVSARIPQGFVDTLKAWRKTEKVVADWMNKFELPIGVFCGPMPEARIFAQMCLARGWRIPQDVAIVAGNNEELFCEHPRPSLSSLELGQDRIGYEAARMLDRLMNRKKRGQKIRPTKAGSDVEHVLIPPKALVLRESTDFFAVDDEIIAQALEFIATNSHKPIGPDDVAKALTAHTRTLQRRFSKYLNSSIAAEIRRVRFERAKRELTQSDRSIAQISAAVGFGLTPRMNQVFRHELGVTPSEYRQQTLGDTAK